MNQKVNESHYQQLREQRWRRKLTANEEESLQAYFLTHPEGQADWEAEASLNQQLGRLPDAPVASNFTALVMQAIDREIHDATRAEEELPRLWHWLRRWAPRAAWASLALAECSWPTRNIKASLARNWLGVSPRCPR